MGSLILLLVSTVPTIGLFVGLALIMKKGNNKLTNQSNNTNNTTPDDKTRINELNRRIFASHFGFASKGETGENYIELQLISLNIPKKIIRNAYIPNKNTTAEIDLILITEYGIYVIESKNYSGWIFGSENRRNWTQTLNKKSKYKFYNPILQNRTHIKALSNYLNISIKKFHSFIVFSQNSELKQIPQNTDEYCIMYDYQLNSIIQRDIQNCEKIIQEEYIGKIYNLILPTTQVSQEEKQQHINEAQKYI